MAIGTSGNVGIGVMPSSFANTKLNLGGNLQFSNTYGFLFTKSDGTLGYWSVECSGTYGLPR